MKIINDIHSYLVTNSCTVKQAVRVMDIGGIGLCMVVGSDLQLEGIITDGDFRRAVLQGVKLDDNVSCIQNNDFLCVNHGVDASSLFVDPKVLHVPVLQDGRVVAVYTKSDYKEIDGNIRDTINKDVVIMAGGKGTRLDPFTRILPKPLLPIGNVPIIKVIMDEFTKYGMRDFHISINDKADMVKAYFHDNGLQYNIDYIEESKSLGTVGALKLLKSDISTPFFLSNCDVILHTDYDEILKFHEKGEYGITIVASMRHYTVPYGVCKLLPSGALDQIKEKPEYDFFVNTGFYLVNSSLIEFIPDDEAFDMTELIIKVKEANISVGVYPVTNRAWNDTGQWDEYNNTVDLLSD